MKLLVHTEELCSRSVPLEHTFCLSPQNLHKYCLHFLLGVKMALTETENNAYAKFWGDKHRALWYAMVFYVVVNQNMIRYSPEAFDPHGLQVL